MSSSSEYEACWNPAHASALSRQLTEASHRGTTTPSERDSYESKTIIVLTTRSTVTALDRNKGNNVGDPVVMTHDLHLFQLQDNCLYSVQNIKQILM